MRKEDALMKQQYEQAQIEIVLLSTGDVITTSGDICSNEWD